MSDETKTAPAEMTWDTATGSVSLSEWGLAYRAMQIAKWVNANGGGARFEPEWKWSGYGTPYSHPTRIVITGPSSPVYVAPGDTVVMGDRFGVGPVLELRIHEDSGLELPVYARTLREFTVRPASRFQHRRCASGASR